MYAYRDFAFATFSLDNLLFLPREFRTFAHRASARFLPRIEIPEERANTESARAAANHRVCCDRIFLQISARQPKPKIVLMAKTSGLSLIHLSLGLFYAPPQNGLIISSSGDAGGPVHPSLGPSNKCKHMENQYEYSKRFTESFFPARRSHTQCIRRSPAISLLRSISILYQICIKYSALK